MTREEAINEIKSWAIPSKKGREVIETLIPELRESEDERIRRELIEYLRGDLDDITTDDTDRWITWIEKQKDYILVPKSHLDPSGKPGVDGMKILEKQEYDRMKPIYDARESFESALEKAWNDYHNGYENVDKLEDDYVECAHAKGFREGYLFGLEKQKELPFVKDVVLGFPGLYFYDGERMHFRGNPALEDSPYYFAMKQQEEKQKEQKPKVEICPHSIKSKSYLETGYPIEQKPIEKQDYSGLTDLERAIHRGFLAAGVENVPVTIIKETAQDCLAQQKPAEWSKEDEEMLDATIDIVSGSFYEPLCPRKEMLAWLKSLRPSWKPSEEQMSALEIIVRYGDKESTHIKSLRDLYEHLKKL